MAELNEEMKKVEEELKQVKNQIQMIELMILERKSNNAIEGSPTSPLIVGIERSTGDGSDSLSHTPAKINNQQHVNVVSSVPRFMASTACSRRRQSVSVENVSKLSSRVALRFGNRSSLDMLKSSLTRKMFQD